MNVILKFVAILILVFLICYPFTSLIATCASYPLEDYFFPIYWPLANWLNHQGLSVIWASPLAVIVPNVIIVFVLFKSFTLLRDRIKNK